MNSEFEWVDFAMQAPNAMAESLDAAGIDAAVPCHCPEDAGGHGRAEGASGQPPAIRDVS